MVALFPVTLESSIEGVIMTGPELIVKVQNMFGLDLPLRFERVNNTRGYIVVGKEGYPTLAGFIVYNDFLGYCPWSYSGWRFGGTLSTAHEAWGDLLDLND